jgi:hypothetical protein
MQSKAKVHFPDGRVGRLKGSTGLAVPKPQAFIGVCGHESGQSWRTGLCASNFWRLVYVLSIPPTCWGGGCLSLGLLEWGYNFFVGSKSCGSARPCCTSQVILLMSAVQDVTPYQHPGHHCLPLGFLTP